MSTVVRIDDDFERGVPVVVPILIYRGADVTDWIPAEDMTLDAMAVSDTAIPVMISMRSYCRRLLAGCLWRPNTVNRGDSQTHWKQQTR